MSFGYVVLSASRSFPAVLPSSSVDAVTSRMSSATWNARPILRAYSSHLATSASVAPARTAPVATAALSSAAVLCVWIHASVSRPTSLFPSLFRSSTCPPARPTGPTHCPSIARTVTTRSAGTPLVFFATYSNAVESIASPARIATSSP
jgi:hypothetical protein